LTRRREIQLRLRQLREIGEIMRSMKNLALMETHKLGRFRQTGNQLLEVLETAALDFLASHPQPPVPAATPAILLAIGSERGFCGEFNDQIRKVLESGQPPAAVSHIAVGSRLCGRFEECGIRHRPLAGATIAEDLPDVLAALGNALCEVQPQSGMRLAALYQDGSGEVRRKTLLPPFADHPQPRETGFPPLLYLAPDQFYREWLEHYLLAALQAVLQQSLLAENEVRVRHLEGALQRLEEKAADLGRRNQALRQEEITEEIEIILLSAEGLRPS